MFDNQFTLSDIHIEVIETADRYMKAVLINTKNRYFRVLRKLDRDGVTIFELENMNRIWLMKKVGLPGSTVSVLL